VYVPTQRTGRTIVRRARPTAPAAPEPAPAEAPAEPAALALAPAPVPAPDVIDLVNNENVPEGKTLLTDGEETARLLENIKAGGDIVEGAVDR
jgi:hypothetical protein